MLAGKLHHPASIEKPSYEQDPDGDMFEAWVEGQSGGGVYREYQRARAYGRPGPQTLYKITLHYRADLKSS